MRGVAEGSQKTEMTSNESGTKFLLCWGRGSDSEGREGRVSLRVTWRDKDIADDEHRKVPVGGSVTRRMYARRRGIGVDTPELWTTARIVTSGQGVHGRS